MTTASIETTDFRIPTASQWRTRAVADSRGGTIIATAGHPNFYRMTDWIADIYFVVLAWKQYPCKRYPLPMNFLTLPEASWAQPILSGARRAFYLALLLLPGTVIVLPLLWWLNRRALNRHEIPIALSGLLARKAGLKEEDRRLSLPHNPKGTGSNPITTPNKSMVQATWRDRRLMQLIAHKRKAGRDS